MSEGLLAIHAAIHHRSREVLRQIQRPFLIEDEEHALNVLEAAMRRYGDFPTLDIMEQWGVVLPDLDDPVQPALYYVDRLHERAMFQAARDAAAGAAEALRSNDASSAAQAIIEGARRLNSITVATDVTPLATAAADVVTAYHTARRDPEAVRGIPLGIPTLDSATNGIQPGELWTYVARPNVGKSWLMVHTALSAWLAGHSVVFVSMEMEVVQIARRALAGLARVNPDFLKRGTLSMHAEQEVYAALNAVEHGPPFHILAGNLEKRVSEVDALVQEFEPRVLLVDAAYMLESENLRSNSREFERIAQTTKELTGLGLSRRIPVVQSVQFNRDGARDRNQGLEAIAGSDAISKNSSGVISIMEGPPPHEQSTRVLTTLKLRDGRKPDPITINFRFQPWDFSEVVTNNNDLDAEGNRVADQSWQAGT